MNELTITKELEGLEKSKAKQIEAVFKPMVEMLKEFEAVYDGIIVLEINPETCQKAKRLRLDIARVRIEADKIRKIQKEEYLRAGNAIQGVYNILKFAVVDKEEKLKDIECHYERIEEEKKRQLQIARETKLEKYDVDVTTLDLGGMNIVVWDNFLSGTKANYEAVVAAEEKAEQDRIEMERKVAEEQEKIRLENERLKKEADKAAKAKAEADRKIEKERQIQAEKIQKEREIREELEREIAEKEAEAKRKAQEEADRKIEADRKAQLAPDKEKLNIIAVDLLAKMKTVTAKEAQIAIKTASDIIFNAIERM